MTILYDTHKFITCKASNPEHTALAKALESKHGVKIVFVKKVSRAPASIGFTLDNKSKTVYIRQNLTTPDFNFTIFHEIRHIQQIRKRPFIMFWKEGNVKKSDRIRYLFDCLYCEIDADLYAVRECSARGLPYSLKSSYLTASNKNLISFIKILDEEHGDVKLSNRVYSSIVSETIGVIRRRR